MSPLNNQHRNRLKKLCHALKPVVIVGQKGLQGNVLDEIVNALEHHELIKIKLNAERDTRKEYIAAICDHTGGEVIQTIGQTVSLYRRNREKPKIGI